MAAFHSSRSGGVAEALAEAESTGELVLASMGLRVWPSGASDYSLADVLVLGE
jgi:hypothetical protein